MKSISHLYLAGAALLIDGATLVAIGLVLQRLTPIMASTGGLSALILGGAFLLFVAGVFVFRRMKATPDGAADWLSRRRRMALALAFAFIISMALAWQLGFFRSGPLVDTTQMGEGGSASYFVFGPGAWLAFSLLYVLVFAFDVTPAIEPGSSGYIAAALFGLAAANAMLVVFAAQAQTIVAAAEAAGWWSVVALALLVVMFLPPRLLYLSRTVGLRSPAAYGVLAVFLVLLGVCAAQIGLGLF